MAQDAQGRARRQRVLVGIFLIAVLGWSVQEILKAMGPEGAPVKVLLNDEVYLNGDASPSDAVLLLNVLRETRFRASPFLTVELHVFADPRRPRLIRVWMDDAWISNPQYRLMPEDAERISRRVFGGAAVEVEVPGADGQIRMGTSTPAVKLPKHVRQLVERHGGPGIRKQLHRRSVVKGIDPWRWDPERGTLTYGDGSSWDATRLGYTRIDGRERSWHWICEGPRGEVVRQRLEALADPDWRVLWEGGGSLTVDLFLRALTAALAGMMDADDMIALRDDLGTNIFMIDDGDWPSLPPLDVYGLAIVLDRLTSSWPIDHLPGTFAAVSALGCAITGRNGEPPTRVRAQCSGLPPLDLYFDDSGRYRWTLEVTN